MHKSFFKYLILSGKTINILKSEPTLYKYFLSMKYIFCESTSVSHRVGILDLRVKHKERNISWPWPGARLVRASSQCTKVTGSIPSQGTCKNQPMDA